MRKGLWKKILLVVIAVVLLSAALPVVSAYEGHLVDVRAHVEQPPFLSKTARLATSCEIEYAISQGIQFPDTPNPPSVTDPFNVPQDTCIAWIVTIAIQNFSAATMERVTVQDTFNGEVAIALLSASQGSVNIIHGEDDRIEYWEIYDFAPCETATLQVIVWTVCNPDCGDQEFTDTGLYWLNSSGAIMKWYEWQDECFWEVQGSYSTGPALPVTVY